MTVAFKSIASDPPAAPTGEMPPYPEIEGSFDLDDPRAKDAKPKPKYVEGQMVATEEGFHGTVIDRDWRGHGEIGGGWWYGVDRIDSDYCRYPEAALSPLPPEPEGDKGVRIGESPEKEGMNFTDEQLKGMKNAPKCLGVPSEPSRKLLDDLISARVALAAIETVWRTVDKAETLTMAMYRIHREIGVILHGAGMAGMGFTKVKKPEGEKR